MEIKFFDSQEYSGSIKAAIQNTGKLGFTEAAIKKLGISEAIALQIGSNVNDPTDRNLYVIISSNKERGAFKVNKAGKYFYVNTKNLFDSLQYPYRTKRIAFDIVEMEIGQREGYKFIYQESEKKSNESNNENDETDLV